MQVSISIGGRFHAFDMAWQLQKRGFLNRLITSYPEFKVREWNIEPQRIRTVLSHELICRGYRSAARKFGWVADPQYHFNNRYDRIASRRLPEGSDIVVAWSGMGLHTLRRAQRMGSLAVLERNSTHIEFQRDILKEEYAIAGATPLLPNPRLIERELEEYAAADYICLPSKFTERTFLEAGVPAHKLLTVPFGTDIESFPCLPKEKHAFRIVFCGSITVRKGIHYLLRAFHELNLPDAELWLVGPVAADGRPFLEKYASPNIHVRGVKPQAELYKEYNNASVFSLPSLEEGFSHVIQQAMACGLPVICSTNTGACDLVRDGVDGFIVPIRDVEALKASIVELYRNPERAAEMGRSARRLVETRSTWDHFGDRLVSAYEGILSRRGAAMLSAAGVGEVA